MNATVVTLVVYAVSMLALSLLFARTHVLTPQTLARSSPLDALRGILATSVICHHLVVTYFWKTTGSWVPPESAVLNNLGVVPVALFFMITGFLFFGKVYQRRPDFMDILKSRTLRVMPLYIVVVVFVIVLSVFETGFVSAGLKQISKELFKWIVFSGGSFNGFADSNMMTAGAHWTLRYEWIFYLSLPVIAALCNRAWYGKYLLMSALFVTVIMAAISVGMINSMLFLLFVVGFVPVLIKRHFAKSIALFNTSAMSVVAALLIGYAMTLSAFSFLQIVTLALPFTCLALGNNLFGLLAGKGLKSLGEVSYSLYLTHGAVLYVGFSVLHLFSFENTQLASFMVFLPPILLVVSAVSYVTYTFIEKPFIAVRKPGILVANATDEAAGSSSPEAGVSKGGMS